MTAQHSTAQHSTAQHPIVCSQQESSTSIIIPVYNVEPYLRQCIDSAIAQTCRSVRIILVDDGSTDSSGSICDEYSQLDPRITVIHKPNGGLSDARNAGLAQADTKYVYFLDSDDWIAPETIELLEGLAEQDSLDLIGFDAAVVLEEGCDTRKASYFATKSSYPGVMKGYELYEALRRHGDYKAPVQLYFYNREFLMNNSLTFKKGIIHEDELFTFAAMLSAQRAAHVPAVLYKQRIRANSIMDKPLTPRNSDSMYAILQEILQKYKHFRDNPDTRPAYDSGVKYLASSYTRRYLASFGSQNENGHRQFTEMMRELRAAGFDASEYERRVKFRHLYSLKETIKKIPGLKRCKNSAKNLVRHFIPKLDDECRDILARLKDTNTPNSKRIITLVVPSHANRGDIAIALAQRKLLASRFPEHTLIEIPDQLCAQYPHLIIRRLNERDVLLTNGGGWFGSLWRHNQLEVVEIFRHFPNNRIVVMPQTVYYSGDEQGRNELAHDRKAFARFTDLHVFVRDRKSYDLIRRNDLYPNAKSIEHVPDMVCSLDYSELAAKERKGALVCLRPDIERVLELEEQNALYARLLREFGSLRFWSTNPAGDNAKIRDWEQAVNGTLEAPAKCELLVTDRLHGMLFAAITGTPCVAFDNRTGKVHSVHEWISGCGYVQVCGGLDEFEGAMRKALSAPRKWDNSELMPYFDKIKDAIAGKE